MYAKIVDDKTKLCEVGIGTEYEVYKALGMVEMDVEKAYNGSWYVKGYAPEKPAKEEAQEKIYELEAKLARSDYIDNKFIEAIVKGDNELLEALKIKYKDKLEERQAIRNRIDELREIIDDTI